jgi:hypothetical protein
MSTLASSDPCDLPGSYPNHTTSSRTDLKYTFAVNNFTYSESEFVLFYYIVENISQDTITVSEPHEPQRCFAIYPDTCYALDQPGCYEQAVFFEPQIIYLYPTWFHLAPGECEVFTWGWGQTQNTSVPPHPGNFRVFGGLWDANGTWPSHFKLGSGLSLEITIEETPTGIQDARTTWGLIKSLYQ